MEQKKTLWIIAASGVFLLVVFGAALLLNSTPTNAPSTASITTIDRTPVAAQPTVTPITTPTTNQELDSNTLAFQNVENGTTAESTINATTADVTINANTTNIELKTTNTPSINVTATSRAGEEALANVSGTKSNSTASTEKPKSVAKTTEKKSTPKTVAKSTSSTPLSTKYWVQAASFTSKKSADTARTALDDNKIPAEVFTFKDTKDTLYYRVRVGPYTTKSEAEYWQNRICSIDLFKETNSYVTEVKM